MAIKSGSITFTDVYGASAIEYDGYDVVTSPFSDLVIFISSPFMVALDFVPMGSSVDNTRTSVIVWYNNKLRKCNTHSGVNSKSTYVGSNASNDTLIGAKTVNGSSVSWNTSLKPETLIALYKIDKSTCDAINSRIFRSFNVGVVGASLILPAVGASLILPSAGASLLDDTSRLGGNVLASDDGDVTIGVGWSVLSLLDDGDMVVTIGGWGIVVVTKGLGRKVPLLVVDGWKVLTTIFGVGAIVLIMTLGRNGVGATVLIITLGLIGAGAAVLIAKFGLATLGLSGAGATVLITTVGLVTLGLIGAGATVLIMTFGLATFGVSGAGAGAAVLMATLGVNGVGAPVLTMTSRLNGVGTTVLMMTLRVGGIEVILLFG